MNLEVTPPVDENVEHALSEALAEVCTAERRDESAWTEAARTEAVDRDGDYAFSPRSTRGATRA